jgi:hypothetical protein
MKLIQEADTDDQFNNQLMKIQDAIERVEKLVIDHPVSTQIRMLEVAGNDLLKLSKQLQIRRDQKLKK